ncbi:MAG: hypothetical protein AB2693_25390 [Candidatus Thiodiazotropha sp.]
MAKPIVTFEGFAPNYINEDELKMTIKLVPVEQGSPTYGDLFVLLDKYGVKPTDILGCYKVSANDSSFSLFMGNSEVVSMLKRQKFLQNDKFKLMVMGMTEQLLSIRVHWLPLFYENRIIKAMLADYGEVHEIKMCKSSYANLVAMNGIREVLLKTDEIKKQQIPHLINLGCGQSVLLTMQGRPPLCLRCKQVGHTRKDCDPGRRTFAQVAESVARPTAPPVPEPPAETSTGSGDSEAASYSRAAGAEGSGVARDGSEEQPTVENMDSESGRSKRDLDSDDDFIPPNKPARMRPPSSQPVPLENAFAPIMGVGDIMSPNS